MSFVARGVSLLRTLARFLFAGFDLNGTASRLHEVDLSFRMVLGATKLVVLIRGSM